MVKGTLASDSHLTISAGLVEPPSVPLKIISAFIGLPPGHGFKLQVELDSVLDRLVAMTNLE